ncbi:CheY-like superfamily, partial [Ochromonadaceae sp. CCMP2298]
GLLAYPRAGSVRISVVDSGAGLSEQQVKDIGKEGLQFNVSALQGGGGSGLGLFITKGLVLQHGGQMTVTSRGLGKGVSTTLEFPLFDTLNPPDKQVRSDGLGAEHAEFPQPHADTDSQKQREQERQMGARGSGASADGEEVGLELGKVRSRGAVAPSSLMGGFKRPSPVGVAYALDPPAQGRSDTPTFISAHATAPASASASPTHATLSRHMLVVDDAVSNRKLLMRIFKLKGFNCVEAHDGQDALEKYANMCAQGTPPEAILMDYEMPVLNGPSATRLLREQGCSCFILGVTGNVMRADIDFYKSCGADDVFTKPLNAKMVDDLMARISPAPG